MIRRRIDKTGRIVIPKSILQALQWQAETEVVFFEKDGSLLIKRVDGHCLCCKKTDDLFPINETEFLCSACLSRLSGLLKKQP